MHEHIILAVIIIIHLITESKRDVKINLKKTPYVRESTIVYARISIISSRCRA